MPSHSLDRGATVTFLLRSPSAFDNDEVIQKYIKSGKARLFKGDAMKADDISRGWEMALAAGEGRIDVVLFTVGKTAIASLIVCWYADD